MKNSERLKIIKKVKMKRQSALITPAVIKWAREKAHYELNTAAKKIGVTSEKLKEWENEKSLPTMTQARKMSQSL